jgi:hypothetical protein
MVRVAYGMHSAASDVVDQCRRQLEDVEPHLLLAFCGGKHNPVDMLAALRAAFGERVPIAGGSAAGAIARSRLGYSGLELGLAAFVDPATAPVVAAAGDMDLGEVESGRILGRRIAELAEDGAVVIFFYDSVRAVAPLRLHPASLLVEGLHQGLGERKVRLIGGGTLTDMNLSDGWIFDGRGLAKHAAVALVFPPTVTDQTAILHGCRPVSSFMEVTRIDGADLYELDGEPALPVIERRLRMSLADANMAQLSLIATLGEKQGDPFTPYNESDYVNRLILRTDGSTGSITLFEPDFRPGTRVQIMSRDNALMLASVRDGIADLNTRLAGGQSMLGLYIDCAGRASARSGADIEEAELVQTGLDPTVPLLGFYSGVEVAPFGGYSRSLDWTGVMTVLQRSV